MTQRAIHAEPHAALDLSGLRASVRGRAIAPDDPGYDDARRIMYGGEHARPAVIVKVADAADVATVVGIARQTGLELAVRSGGHSGAEHSTTNGGIVIDVRDLRDLEFDLEGRTVWAGTGLTAGEYTAAAAEHGLATGFGDTGSVGLGGLVTGGGVGYLVRKHGLTIDSLLAAEVVTADGRVLMVDESNHPDLFWAIRGGGGNFGVLTRVRLRLHPLPSVTGGILLLPATADVVAGFMAAAEAAPEELSGIANVMPAPPMPFLAPEHHGTMCVFALLCFAGDDEAAQRALAPFRALATPLADMLAPISYAEMFPPDDPEYHPEAVAQTLLMDRVGPAEAALIMDRLMTSDAEMRVAQLRVLGGAMARVPADATAYAHRDRRVMVNLAAFYHGDEERAARQAWVDEFTDALRGDDRAAYVNFLGDEGPDRVRDAYPGSTWDRLVEVKRRYDPDNLFRRNQNIPPQRA